MMSSPDRLCECFYVLACTLWTLFLVTILFSIYLCAICISPSHHYIYTYCCMCCTLWFILFLTINFQCTYKQKWIFDLFQTFQCSMYVVLCQTNLFCQIYLFYFYFVVFVVVNNVSNSIWCMCYDSESAVNFVWKISLLFWYCSLFKPL